MSLRIWNPFIELARCDNVFRDYFQPLSFSLDNFFAPATDVTESKDGFEIQMNVPGIKPTELSVEATSEFIEINAESKPEQVTEKNESEATEQLSRHIERSSRKYYKKILFNVPVDPNTGKVSLKDGVLTINIQKRPEAKKISLNIA